MRNMGSTVGAAPRCRARSRNHTPGSRPGERAWAQAPRALTRVHGVDGSGATRSEGARLQQIPQVAVEVAKHRHRAIGFALRLAHELDTLGAPGRVVACEVVC